MAVSSFPILGLPKDAILDVLRNMDYLEILSFSLCSKTTKKISTSLNIKSDYFIIHLLEIGRAQICVGVENDFFYIGFNFERIGDLWKLSSSGNEDWRTYHFDKSISEMREWINHMMTVFNKFQLNLSIEDHQIDFEDIKSIREVLKGVDINISYIKSQSLSDKTTEEQIVKLLQNSKDVEFVKDISMPSELLYSNFDRLLIDQSGSVTLDNVLTINSMRVYLGCSKLSNKHLNSFLKHWISGSNSRLECIEINTEELIFKKDIIFKGIKYEIKNGNEKFEIQRMDGTKARIEFWSNNDILNDWTFCFEILD